MHTYILFHTFDVCLFVCPLDCYDVSAMDHLNHDSYNRTHMNVHTKQSLLYCTCTVHVPYLRHV